MPSQPRRSLSDYELLECIEAGLAKFGPGIEYSVMWRMVILGDSPKEGILANPQAFVAALRSIFGHSARVIEQEVVAQIKSKATSEYSDVVDFAELVRVLRKENLCNLVVV